MIVIDAHQHVWDLESGVYAWPDESVPAIHRSIGIEELLPDLADCGVAGTVLVQAADDPVDTRHMLAVADAHRQVLGVVGWVPLDRPDEAERLLAEFGDDDRFVGVRALIHTYDDPDWILAADPGLDLLERAGLAFDFVTSGPAALDHVPGLAGRHPGLRIVLDHLGKPPISGDAGARADWRRRMAAAAANPLVSAKLSGLYASTGELDSWTVDQVRPFVADALELFGPDRLMYGGDWPVSLLAGGYRRSWEAISGLVDELAPEHRTRILGGTAAEIYRLNPRRIERAGEEQA